MPKNLDYTHSFDTYSDEFRMAVDTYNEPYDLVGFAVVILDINERGEAFLKVDVLVGLGILKLVTECVSHCGHAHFAEFVDGFV